MHFLKGQLIYYFIYVKQKLKSNKLLYTNSKFFSIYAFDFLFLTFDLILPEAYKFIFILADIAH